ncbi:AcrR family transcriptional regulator [Agromyces terreus]|uniref:AcrR family transcriptional regulator n=1 Tax=Agromyces terreus TaxID=424795 RepID=A0A9X2H469_9MICO|nr:TetR family transcriptional regulator [Agromyces terreus]MCP2372470.1 AcrR family transcriptional regulator [Agromyces terreus]
MNEGTGPRRPGRPAGTRSGETRSRILRAATEEFAEVGYEAASVRAIARRAGVDPSLVHHYFDGKAGMVAESVSVPLRPDQILGAVIEAPPHELGALIVRAVVTAWDSAPVRTAATAAMRTAMGRGPVSRTLREFIHREIMLRIADRLEGGQRELRAELALSQVAGLLMVRYVFAFEPLASADVDEVVAAVAPSVQRHLDGAVEGSGIRSARGLDAAPPEAKNSPRDE